MVEFKDKDGKMIQQGLVNYKGIYHLAVVEVTGTLRKKGEDFILDGKSVHVRTASQLDVATYEKKKKK